MLRHDPFFTARYNFQCLFPMAVFNTFLLKWQLVYIVDQDT